MDNVTHTLVGLALARTGLNRLGAGATAVLLLSANAPDVDIVGLAWGQLTYFEVHRGYTHSLMLLPVLAAACVLIAALLVRKRVRWLALWLLACLGVGSHLLLDWTNAYGIRLLLPFSSRWLHLDISSLTDSVILAVLFLAAVLPWFSSLVSREIGDKPGRGRKTAIAALIFYAVFELFRAVMHIRVEAELQSRLYRGSFPLAVSALPHPANPLDWTGVVETSDSYTGVDANALGNVHPDRGQVIYKIPYDRAIRAALLTQPFRYLIYFARFPVWSEQPVTLPGGHGTRVDLTDLRFGAPGIGGFHSVALIDSRGAILDSQFTFASGAKLGLGPQQQ